MNFLYSLVWDSLIWRYQYIYLIVCLAYVIVLNLGIKNLLFRVEYFFWLFEIGQQYRDIGLSFDFK